MNEGVVAKNFFNVFDLTSNQIFAFGVFVIVVGAFLAYLSKKGLFSFQGKGLQFGRGQDLERLILRQQLLYIDAAVEEAMTEIVKKETWNSWKAKYTAELVKDCIQNRCSVNHLSMDRSFILVMQLQVWSAIQKNEMVDPYYSSDEFKQLIYRWAEGCIKDLLDIRKYYEGK